MRVSLVPALLVLLFVFVCILVGVGLLFPTIFAPSAQSTEAIEPRVYPTFIPTPEGRIISMDNAWESCGTEQILRVNFGEEMVNGKILGGAVISLDDPIRQLFVQVDGVWYSIYHNGGMSPQVEGTEYTEDQTLWGSEREGEKRCPRLEGIHIHMVDYDAQIVSYSIPSN